MPGNQPTVKEKRSYSRTLVTQTWITQIPPLTRTKSIGFDPTSQSF